MSSSSALLQYSHTSAATFFVAASFFFLASPLCVLCISSAFPCKYSPPSLSPLLLGRGVGVRWLLCVCRFSFFLWMRCVVYSLCYFCTVRWWWTHKVWPHHFLHCHLASSWLAVALLSVVKSLHLQGGCKCACLVGGLVEDTQSSCVFAYACGSDCRGPFLRKLIKHPVTMWERGKKRYVFFLRRLPQSRERRKQLLCVEQQLTAPQRRSSHLQLSPEFWTGGLTWNIKTVEDKTVLPSNTFSEDPHVRKEGINCNT